MSIRNNPISSATREYVEMLRTTSELRKQRDYSTLRSFCKNKLTELVANGETPRSSRLFAPLLSGLKTSYVSSIKTRAGRLSRDEEIKKSAALGEYVYFLRSLGINESFIPEYEDTNKMSIRNNPKYTIKKKPARSLTLKERAIEALTQTDGVDEPIYEFILYAVRRVDGEEAAREIQDMVEGNESEPVPRRSAPPRSSRPVEIETEPEPDESFGGILNNPRKRGRPPGRKNKKPIRL